MESWLHQGSKPDPHLCLWDDTPVHTFSTSSLLQSLIVTWFGLHVSNLSSIDELHVDVGIAASRIHAVQAVVFTDVFWCCLRKQPIHTLSETGKKSSEILDQNPTLSKLIIYKSLLSSFKLLLALTSQPEPLKGCCPDPSCEPSKPCPWLQGSPEQFLFPLARTAIRKRAVWIQLLICLKYHRCIQNALKNTYWILLLISVFVLLSNKIIKTLK